MLRKFIKFSFYCVSLWLVVSNALAIEPVSGSYEKHYESQKKKDHWLILGAIERIKGAVKPEEEVRVDAKVTSHLWQIPFGHSSADVLEHLKSQLPKGTTQLFSCRGRDCGLSNDFANQVFKQSILYGRESEQVYWIGVSIKPKPVVWVIYAIQRSNKQVFLYLEKVSLRKGEIDKFAKATGSAIETQLHKANYVVLMPLESSVAKFSDKQLTMLNSLLKKYPDDAYAIVVHRYQAGKSPSEIMDKTKAEADQLMKQLSESGAFTQNVYAYGAGAFLPRINYSDRVELVKVGNK